MRVSGTVASVPLHDERTGYCVLRVRQGSGTVTVIGVAASAHEGAYVEATGRWERHPRHGRQMRAKELRLLPPRTRDGLARFFSSGIVKGLGKAKAARLIERFGDSLPEIIAVQPGLLEEVSGISRSLRKEIERAWHANAESRDLTIFLNSHGVTGARAINIQKTYGEKAGEVVRANPYRLIADVEGIGFKRADQIAAHVGIAKDSPARLQAGIVHTLQSIGDDGDCLAAQTALVSATHELLCRDAPALPPSAVEDALGTAIREGLIVSEVLDGETVCLLPAMHRAETQLAEELTRLAPGAPVWGEFDVNVALGWVEGRSGLVLSASQRDAIRLSLVSKLSVITGGPGTGKSTIMDSIVRIVGAKGARVSLCAPTGRAARRLAAATGRDATTIHRLLGYDGRARRYVHGKDNPLETDFVVIDESSMVGVQLMRALLQALPSSAAVLFVGDCDQLPSIEAGAVLDDLIRCGRIPVSRLTEIHRQSGGSAIVRAAAMVRAGVVPRLGNDGEFVYEPCDDAGSIRERILALVHQVLPAQFGFDPRRDIQVLCPLHGGPLGTRAINAALQELLDQSGGVALQRGDFTLRLGDKVVQRKNDHEREVANGDIGLVQHIDTRRRRAVVAFDGRSVVYEAGELEQLALSWGLSAHKSQGSEFPAVVMPLTMAHAVLLDRRLLYTAITRAKQRVILVGERRALGYAVGNNRSVVRRTGLVHRIRGRMGGGGTDADELQF